MLNAMFSLKLEGRNEKKKDKQKKEMKQCKQNKRVYKKKTKQTIKRFGPP